MTALASNGTSLLSAGGGIFASGSVQTFDFYISTTGSDSNPGTLASPWSITAINTKQATYAGKRVGLIQGTYNIQALAAASGSGAGNYVVVTLKCNGGTAGSPTYLASCDSSGVYLPPNPSAPDGSKCGAIITCKVGSVYGNPNNNNGAGTARAGNPMFGFWSQGGLPTNPGYVTVDGIGFTGNISGNVVFGNVGESPAVPGITVKNCEFFDNSGVGSETGDNLTFMSLVTNGALIQNNYFHDAVGYSAGSADHLSTILFWWPSVSNVIEKNTCINCGSIFGKSQAGASPDINGSIVRYNYVDVSAFTSGGPVAIQDFGDTTTIPTQIYGNIAIGQQPLGLFKVEGGNTTGEMDVFGNTAVITSGGDLFGIGSSISGTLKQYNNIVWNNSGGAMNEGFALLTISSLSVLDYNLYCHGSGSDKWTSWVSQGAGTGYTGLPAWQSATAKDAHAVAATTSPLFVGSGGTSAFYQLQPGSAGKNLGRIGGISSGGVIDAGAWGQASSDGVSQIGSTLKP